MAIRDLPVLLGTKINKQVGLDGVGANNVFGGGATLRLIDIDNKLVANPTYLKLYDHVAPTIGTTGPDMVFRVEALTRTQIHLPEGLNFAAGLSLAAVTTPGTGGTGNPANSVTVQILA